MKFTVAVLLMGAVVATQAHYLPSSHHGHHGSNDLDQGEDYLWDDSHAEEPRKWTGPIHVPVIKNGVPTETPEVRHAKAHLEHKLAEAKSHPDYHSKEEDCDDEEQDKWSHHQHNHGVHHESHASHKHHSGHGDWNQEEEHDHHHGEHRWTGPVHVPVIKHGVPTETPEVRHAKAHLLKKLAEAKTHHDSHPHHFEDHHHFSHEPSHHAGHSGGHRWTGPVHVPVIEHGVPTETPEVKHAKALLHAKHAEAKLHPEFDADCEDNEKFASHGHHDHHHQHHSHNEVFHHKASHHGHEEHHRWTGPIHVPVLHHGVPTETPEVQKARAHHQHKLEEAKRHPHFQDEEEAHHHAARFVEARNEGHNTRHWKSSHSHGAHKLSHHY